MADYKADGAVENEEYCMPSFQKRNVDSMNKAMGYHNMADLANTKKAPVAMEGAKSNPQLNPKMPGEDRFNYNGNR